MGEEVRGSSPDSHCSSDLAAEMDDCRSHWETIGKELEEIRNYFTGDFNRRVVIP